MIDDASPDVGVPALAACALLCAAAGAFPAQDDLPALQRQFEQRKAELERQWVQLEELRTKFGQVALPDTAGQEQ